MLARVVLGLCRLPTVRRRLWRGLYDGLSRRFPDSGWLFMNYGYHDDQLTIEADVDPISASSGALYRRVIRGIDLRGRDVLEVGCGRGGGAALVQRTSQARRVIGLDGSPRTAAVAQRNGGAAGRAFLAGSAEQLPFADASFDAVMSVESSHCYGDRPQFLRESARVLRPGGYLLLADLFDPHEPPQVRAAAEAAGLRLVGDDDLTPGVVAALGQTAAPRADLIKKLAPWWLRGPLRRFAGASDGGVRDRLQRREVTYGLLAWSKPGPG